MARTYFKAYHDLLEQLAPYNDAECGRLFRACLEYSRDGTEPELTGNERFIWPSMKAMIDRSVKDYTEICEARAEAGKKGAEARWQKNSKMANAILPYGKNGKNGEEKRDKREEIREKKEEEENNTRAPARERHKYGEYKNVLLSDSDMDKLKTEFPGDYEQRIERLSEYLAQTGKSYKNHLATIRNWARRENEKESKNEPTRTEQHKRDAEAARKRWNINYDIDGSRS